MKIKVKKTVNVKDGVHSGVVVNIRYRHTPFDYTDLIIQLLQNGEPVELKAGYPTVISENSKLGMLLSRFGETLHEGVEIDPDEVLKGKEVNFETHTEINNKGKFAKVDPDSVRPGEVIQGELK